MCVCVCMYVYVCASDWLYLIATGMYSASDARLALQSVAASFRVHESSPNARSTSDRRPLTRKLSSNPELSRQASAEPGGAGMSSMSEQLERDAHELLFIRTRLEQGDALARHVRRSSYARTYGYSTVQYFPLLYCFLLCNCLFFDSTRRRREWPLLVPPIEYFTPTLHVTFNCSESHPFHFRNAVRADGKAVCSTRSAGVQYKSSSQGSCSSTSPFSLVYSMLCTRTVLFSYALNPLF